MTVAGRMMDLGTETAFEVLAKARALEARGMEIIHLEIGEPGFDTPKHVVEAGRRGTPPGVYPLRRLGYGINARGAGASRSETCGK